MKVNRFVATISNHKNLEQFWVWPNMLFMMILHDTFPLFVQCIECTCKKDFMTMKI